MLLKLYIKIATKIIKKYEYSVSLLLNYKKRHIFLKMFFALFLASN